MTLATLAEAEAPAPASAGQAAMVCRDADSAHAVAAALVATAPADPTGQRAVAVVHQQTARAWRRLPGHQADACTSLRASRGAWQALASACRMRQGDLPRQAAVMRELARCQS